MNSVLTSFVHYDWHNGAMGTSPNISMELVNVQRDVAESVKGIFESTLHKIGALDYIDDLAIYEFNERKCPKGTPLKLHFICASFGQTPEGSNLQTMEIISLKIAKEIKHRFG